MPVVKLPLLSIKAIELHDSKYMEIWEYIYYVYVYLFYSVTIISV